MELSTYSIPVRKVELMHGTLYVRGVALKDVTDLIRDHLKDLTKIVDLYGDPDTRDAALSQGMNFAIKLVSESPEMVATLISNCTNGISREVAATMQASAQIKAIEGIFDLTFEEAGGVKKFVDSVLNLVASMRPAIPSAPDSNT